MTYIPFALPSAFPSRSYFLFFKISLWYLNFELTLYKKKRGHRFKIFLGCKLYWAVHRHFFVDSSNMFCGACIDALSMFALIVQGRRLERKCQGKCHIQARQLPCILNEKHLNFHDKNIKAVSSRLSCAIKANMHPYKLVQILVLLSLTKFPQCGFRHMALTIPLGEFPPL